MSKISLYFTIDDVKSFVEQGLSYEEISSQMKNLHPRAGGLSERSIRRFCKEHSINKNCTMSEESKKETIQASIAQVLFFFLVEANRSLLFFKFPGKILNILCEKFSFLSKAKIRVSVEYFVCL